MSAPGRSLVHISDRFGLRYRFPMRRLWSGRGSVASTRAKSCCVLWCSPAPSFDLSSRQSNNSGALRPSRVPGLQHRITAIWRRAHQRMALHRPVHGRKARRGAGVWRAPSQGNVWSERAGFDAQPLGGQPICQVGVQAHERRWDAAGAQNQQAARPCLQLVQAEVEQGRRNAQRRAQCRQAAVVDITQEMQRRMKLGVRRWARPRRPRDQPADRCDGCANIGLWPQGEE